ncbi:hypothetical protein MMC11_007711 [Xylographa trunciseda]|nr:hypothetical protein [Xylographa trunciseda]
MEAQSSEDWMELARPLPPVDFLALTQNSSQKEILPTKEVHFHERTTSRTCFMPSSPIIAPNHNIPPSIAGGFQRPFSSPPAPRHSALKNPRASQSLTPKDGTVNQDSGLPLSSQTNFQERRGSRDSLYEGMNYLQRRRVRDSMPEDTRHGPDHRGTSSTQFGDPSRLVERHRDLSGFPREVELPPERVRSSYAESVHSAIDRYRQRDSSGENNLYTKDRYPTRSIYAKTLYDRPTKAYETDHVADRSTYRRDSYRARSPGTESLGTSTVTRYQDRDIVPEGIQYPSERYRSKSNHEKPRDEMLDRNREEHSFPRPISLPRGSYLTYHPEVELYEESQTQGNTSTFVSSRDQENTDRNSFRDGREPQPHEVHTSTPSSPSDMYHDFSSSYRERESRSHLNAFPEVNHPQRPSFRYREDSFTQPGTMPPSAVHQAPFDVADSQASGAVGISVDEPEDESGWRCVDSGWRSANGRMIKRESPEITETATSTTAAEAALVGREIDAGAKQTLQSGSCTQDDKHRSPDYAAKPSRRQRVPTDPITAIPSPAPHIDAHTERERGKRRESGDDSHDSQNILAHLRRAPSKIKGLLAIAGSPKPGKASRDQEAADHTHEAISTGKTNHHRHVLPESDPLFLEPVGIGGMHDVRRASSEVSQEAHPTPQAHTTYTQTPSNVRNGLHNEVSSRSSNVSASAQRDTYDIVQ